MNIENLITTIERMEADLTALKLKARQIKPVLDALATLSAFPSFQDIDSVADIERGMVFKSSVDINTHNGYTIPADTEFSVEINDRSTIPLNVRWERSDGSLKADWVAISPRGIRLSKLTRIK